MIDIEVARTFLAVIETGSFQAAASKVNVTQSTVSMRIKTLEERLGERVFSRAKSGAILTAHGYHFERYARTIVRAWEQGRQQVGIPEQYDDMLVIGGQYNLWARLLTQWLVTMQTELTKVAFRAEAGTALNLSRLLSEGLIDIAVLHQPRFRTDIVVDHLMDDELVLVTSDPGGTFEDRYVYVDWGDAFRDLHAQQMPKFMEPRTSVSIGFFGPSFLITAEAAGYLPRRLAQPHIETGHLTVAPDAPVFTYPVYVAYQAESDSACLERAIEVLRQKARLAGDNALPEPFWARKQTNKTAP